MFHCYIIIALIVMLRPEEIILKIRAPGCSSGPHKEGSFILQDSGKGMK